MREADLEFVLERVDLPTRITETGADFTAINSKDYVPVLEIASGERLTEATAILQYIADLKPEASLAPLNGTFERARLQEMLNFLATELHKGFRRFIARRHHIGEPRSDSSAIDPAKSTKSSEAVAPICRAGVSRSPTPICSRSRHGSGLPTSTSLPGPRSRTCKRIAARPAVREAMTAGGMGNAA